MTVRMQTSYDFNPPAEMSDNHLWSALRLFATRPDALTPVAKQAFDNALQHTDPHTYDRDWNAHFLYSCSSGLTEQIWHMISARGGPDTLSDLSSEYLDTCESLYFDSAHGTSSRGTFDERLRALLESAAIDAEYHEHTKRSIA